MGFSSCAVGAAWAARRSGVRTVARRGRRWNMVVVVVVWFLDVVWFGLVST
jgi:hypothetical protein